ncbi:MAG: hypothetical protein LKCHEGNO_02831 [Burkholderiaceae bacterium]|nr:hypothetical protein [Burkholderiaceae bacterium]
MTLPIDMTGAVWFVSQAIWEWENVPVTPPDTATTSSADDPQSGPCEQSDPEPKFVRELVFKGFSFDTRYNWVYNQDSPLAHPWEPDDEHEDTRLKAHGPGRPAADELPSVSDDAWAPTLPPPEEDSASNE